MNDPGYGCSDAACTPCSWPSSLQGQPACLSTGDTHHLRAALQRRGLQVLRRGLRRGDARGGLQHEQLQPVHGAAAQDVLVSSIVCGGAGGCDYGQCQAGFEDLDGDRANGCETRNPKTVKLAARSCGVRGDVGLEPTESGIRWRDQSGRGNDLIGRWERAVREGRDREFLCNQMGPPAIAENFNGSGRRYVSFGTAFAGHAETSWPIDLLYDGPYTVFVVAGRQSGRALRFATGTGGACSGDCRNTGSPSATATARASLRPARQRPGRAPSRPTRLGAAGAPGGGALRRRARPLLRVTDAAGVVQSAANANLEPLRRPLCSPTCAWAAAPGRRRR